MGRFSRIINAINEWTGKIIAFLFFPMAIFATYEVIMRYVFNRPTIWVWEINIQLMALIIFLGGAYTYLHGSHVRVDLLTSRFSEKTRAILDIVTSPIFFFACIILIWKGSERAMEAVVARETTVSIFASPLYPLWIMLPIGVFLFMLQGVSKLYNDILILTHRQSKLGDSNSKPKD